MEFKTPEFEDAARLSEIYSLRNTLRGVPALRQIHVSTPDALGFPLLFRTSRRSGFRRHRAAQGPHRPRPLIFPARPSFSRSGTDRWSFRRLTPHPFSQLFFPLFLFFFGFRQVTRR